MTPFYICPPLFFLQTEVVQSVIGVLPKTPLQKSWTTTSKKMVFLFERKRLGRNKTFTRMNLYKWFVFVTAYIFKSVLLLFFFLALNVTPFHYFALRWRLMSCPGTLTSVLFPRTSHYTDNYTGIFIWFKTEKEKKSKDQSYNGLLWQPKVGFICDEIYLILIHKGVLIIIIKKIY